MLGEREMLEEPGVREIHSKLTDDNWIYNEHSAFSNTLEHKFPWGYFEFNFEVKNGKIVKTKIYSDCLFPDFVSEIEKLFS